MTDFYKAWYNAQGQYHRLDGPAVEWLNGDKSWFVNGKFYCATYQSTKDFILGMLAWCEEVSRLTTKGEK